MIYFDNAATTLHKPSCVMEAVLSAMQQLGNAGRGVHEASLDAARIIYDTRMRLAELFGAESPEQVAFTANSTESLNIAIQGIFEPGDHVITTQMEHNSVLRPLYFMETRGGKTDHSSGGFQWKYQPCRTGGGDSSGYEGSGLYACFQSDRQRQ